MIAIFKREFMSFFHSFTGWLFLAVTILITGVYFTAYNMFYGDPNISGILASVIFLFIITIPILTMGTLAEDRKYKTDQLILTAPVTVLKIVLGKYMALLAVFAIPVIVIGVIPIVMSAFGTFQMGVSYTALLGFFLYGALALAIGLFLSSLTESFIIAAVAAFVVLFLGYIMSGICNIISQSGNIFTRILSAFDMFGRFEAMISGNLYIPSVVYFVTITMLMLFCTVQSIQKRRYTASGNGIELGVYSLRMIVFLTLVTVLVNVLVYRLPADIISLDVTSTKLFTMTDRTKEFVASMSDDVNIYVLANEDNKDDNFDKMLQKIGDLSEHITITYVDPDVNPWFYTNYSDVAPSNNSMIVVGPKRSRVVDYENIYTYEMDYATYQYQVTGYDGEGQIVSALAFVTTDDMPKIYTIIGHNELVLEEKYIEAIQKENIDCEELSLLNVNEIPEDAEAIIINAPITDFSSDDADKVIAYLEKGGNAVIIPTWTGEAMPNFEKVLDYYGVSVTEGMIVEGNMDMYYNEDPFMLFPQVDYSELNDGVSVIFAPYAQGINYDDTTENMYYQPLLETSESSYCKVSLDTEINTRVDKSEGDIDGPFTIAVAAEKNIGNDIVSKVIFAACENLFSEDADSIVSGNNVRLFINSLSSLVEHESSVSIPVKYYDAEALIFSTRDIVAVGAVSILIIPICCLVTGFVIWFRRRKR